MRVRHAHELDDLTKSHADKVTAEMAKHNRKAEEVVVAHTREVGELEAKLARDAEEFRHELAAMKSSLRPITATWLCAQNDKTIRAYTGLPAQGIEVLFVTLERADFPSTVARFKLGWKEMVLLTLHWLKVDPTFVVLMHSFGMKSTSSVHDVIYATLQVLKTVLWRFIKEHPEKFRQRSEELRAAEFARVKLIGDCTQFQVEKPGHHEHSKAVWSTYKACHSAKIFVACDGRGWPAFISPLYTGSISDDAIIIENKAAFLALFSEGDAFMYDKGVTETVRRLLAEKKILLITPSFVYGGVLPLPEQKSSRRISTARVLIENVNERAKRFRLLNHVFPSNVFSIAGTAVEICFLLTVLMGPVRKKKEKDEEEEEEDEEEEEGEFEG